MSKIYVWDPVVRVFHWTLVLAFLIAYVSGEEESTIHTWSGYLILGLIAIRVIWGLIGSRHARFTNFIRRPSVAVQYMRELVTFKHPRRYLGHNPAGGLMVVALLSSLVLTGYTGMKVQQAEGYGLLAGNTTSVQIALSPVATAHADDDDHEDENEAEEFWEEIHEFFANFTVFLVFLHVAGVLFSSLLESQNLIRSMITGYKQQE